MGLGDMFSSIFGGGNKYRNVNSPIMGRPRRKGESAAEYQQAMYNDYARKVGGYEGQIGQARTMGLPQDTLDFSGTQGTMGDLSALAKQLVAQGQGQGPNPALEQLKQTTAQNIANQAAMAAGSRGINPALAMRSAAMGGANANQTAAGQAALQAAQQQLASQQLAGGVLGNLGGLQQNQAIAQGQAGLGLLGARTGREAMLQQALSQYQNNLQNAYNAMNNINAGVAAQNAQTAGQYGQGILGGLSSAIGGIFHEGGEVPESFVDAVRRKGMKLSDGGEAKVGTVMKEFDKGKLKSSSGDKVKDRKQAIAIALSEAGLSNKMANGGLSQFQAFASGDPLSAQLGMANQNTFGQEMLDRGMGSIGSKVGGKLNDFLSSKFSEPGADSIAKGLNTGPFDLTRKTGFQPSLGSVDFSQAPAPSAPPTENPTGQWRMIASAPWADAMGTKSTFNGTTRYVPFDDTLSEGGKVGGRAKTDGDSIKNDTVPALLSPGEIVIPRSASDDPEEAHAFLDKILKKKIKGYGDVLKAQRLRHGGYID